MIEYLEIDGYKMGCGGELAVNGNHETYHAIREQLYAQMMGWTE